MRPALILGASVMAAGAMAVARYFPRHAEDVVPAAEDPVAV